MDWDSIPEDLFQEARQITLVDDPDFSAFFDFGHGTSSSVHFPCPPSAEAHEGETEQFVPVSVTNQPETLKRSDFTYMRLLSSSEPRVEVLETVGATLAPEDMDPQSVDNTVLPALQVSETVQPRRTRRETKPREHVSNPYGRKGNKRCANCRKWRQKACFDLPVFVR
jgi:hypothetical protein